MHKSNRMKEVYENVEVFFTIVEKSRKKKQLRDHLISLTMKLAMSPMVPKTAVSSSAM